MTQYATQDGVLLDLDGRRFFDESRSMQDEVAATHIVRRREARAFFVIDRRAYDDEPIPGTHGISHALLKQVDEFQGRRLTQVVHVFLVCETNHQNMRLAQRFGPNVERLRDRLYNMVRHGPVNLAG